MSVAGEGGRLVDVGGVAVYVEDSGRDGPPVVIEAGAGGCGVEWAEIAELLAPRRVVRLDRPGLGRSPYARLARDAESSARFLHDVLHAAGMATPVVLVGHSISGLSCRAFAYLYPDDLAGMVLVDPFDEDTDDDALPRGFETVQQVGLRVAATLARFGLTSVIARGMVAGARRVLSRPDRPGVQQRLEDIARAVSTAASFRAQADAAAVVATSRAQLRVLVGERRFPQVPLRVLTPDSPAVNRTDRLVRAQNLQQLHPREAAASARGSHHVVAGSSHMAYLDQPHILAEHIDQVAAEARET